MKWFWVAAFVTYYPDGFGFSRMMVFPDQRACAEAQSLFYASRPRERDGDKCVRMSREKILILQHKVLPKLVWMRTEKEK